MAHKNLKGLRRAKGPSVKQNKRWKDTATGKRDRRRRKLRRGAKAPGAEAEGGAPAEPPAEAAAPAGAAGAERPRKRPKKAAPGAEEAPAGEAPPAGAAAGAAPAGKKPAKRLTKRQRREEKEQTAAERHHRALYRPGEKILLIGEGNFSFARALCRHLAASQAGGAAGVYATSFDGEATLGRKYADAKEMRSEIEDKLGGITLVGVDATRLKEVRQFREAFNVIVWNFPHIGGGESDVEKSANDHRKLLKEFFTSAVKCLDRSSSAEIHVALKTGEPYKSWKVVQTARLACPQLLFKTAVPFSMSAWPGYAHRRTAGFDARLSKADNEELAKGAKVYVFLRPSAGQQ